MIESCTKKRMIVGVTCLGGLTFLVLVVESHLASNSTSSHLEAAPRNSSNDCWLREEYEIQEPCHPCSAFEIRSQAIGACVATHYKEVLKCLKSGFTIIRSCDKVTWVEERKFWLFECLTLVIGCIASVVVYARQKILDHRMLRRIQRQLASGV